MRLSLCICWPLNRILEMTHLFHIWHLSYLPPPHYSGPLWGPEDFQTELFQKTAKNIVLFCFYVYFKCSFLFILSLLRWHWLTQLYSFQGYDCLTHQLYIILCVHHSKFHHYLPTLYPLLPPPPRSPLVIMILLSVYGFFCLFVYFYLIPSNFSPNSPTPSLWQQSVCSLFCYFILFIGVHI